MSTQNENPQENLLVKMIKKSVGLSTGKSDCCGAPAEAQSNDCCDLGGSNDCCDAEASQESSVGCCSEEKVGSEKKI